MGMTRPDGRQPDEARPIKITPHFTKHAEGSVLIETGDTKVLTTCSVVDGVPKHAIGKFGWLMAEYNLLPRSTQDRKDRERQKLTGRTVEIQRIIGRAFRSSLDLVLLKNKTIVIDADVLQADGGTRVASMLGGYAALHIAMDKMVRKGKLDEWPLTEFAAVSVAWMGGEDILIDPNYIEDEKAKADITVIATLTGDIIEISGGSEGQAIPRAIYQQMLEMGLAKIPGIVKGIHSQLK